MLPSVNSGVNGKLPDRDEDKTKRNTPPSSTFIIRQNFRFF